MKRYTLKLIQAVFLISCLFSACDNQWDDHVKVTDPQLSSTVLDALAQRPDCSLFYQMVVETGYDGLLQSDRSFTLLVPSNEALEAYVNSPEEVKASIVKNHMAYLSYNSAALARMDKLEMLNGKKLTLKALSFSSSGCDVLCNNGVIHQVDRVVLPLLNVYEYLESLGKDRYVQLDSLMGQTVKVMDSGKSVQTGVNEDGRPVYDTVWTYRNHLLERMPLMNEDSLYTFVLIDNSDFNRIAAKYAKYMKRGTLQQTDSIVAIELIGDLVFKSGTETALSGVKVDFSQAQLVEEYQASNGTVRIMKGVDIKMKENKIKTVYIEGEELVAALNAKFLTRLRPWARGGMDVMLSAYSKQVRDSLDADGNPVKNEKGEIIKIEYTFRYENSGAADSYSSDVNFFMEYNVPVYSADYTLHWVTYDDIPVHVGKDGYAASTLNVQQKLFISLPGEKKLRRESSGQIVNNYLGNTTAFVGSTPAGIYKEVQLKKYTLTNAAQALLAGEVVDDENPLSPYLFTSPTMGKATFWVCNTTQNHGTYSGLMFLDYIRLTPVIDEDE